jgi:hypothetical protein
MNMKKTGTAAVVVLLALWLGYYLGHHNGVQQERRAWLATEQTVTLPPPSVPTNGRLVQSHGIATRTIYTYPYSRMVLAGPTPVNVPDPRALQRDEHTEP